MQSLPGSCFSLPRLHNGREQGSLISAVSAVGFKVTSHVVLITFLKPSET